MYKILLYIKQLVKKSGLFLKPNSTLQNRLVWSVSRWNTMSKKSR